MKTLRTNNEMINFNPFNVPSVENTGRREISFDPEQLAAISLAFNYQNVVQEVKKNELQNLRARALVKLQTPNPFASNQAKVALTVATLMTMTILTTIFSFSTN